MSAEVAQPSSAAPNTHEAIVEEFEQRRQEIAAIFEKMQELDGDRVEHELVLKTLSKLEPERECYRLINNVLVQRTVGEVLPAVEGNSNKIQTLIATLSTKLKQKEDELTEFKNQHGIVVRGEDIPTSQKAQELGNKQ